MVDVSRRELEEVLRWLVGLTTARTERLTANDLLETLLDDQNDEGEGIVKVRLLP